MKTVYYSCFNELWKDSFNTVELTKRISIAMIVSTFLEQEFLPTDFRLDNIKDLTNECFIATKQTEINEIIELLEKGEKILMFVKSENSLYKESQYLAIMDYDKEANSFIVLDPFLTTTKYNKAAKQGLVSYKTASGSTNLISANDALVGFDLHIYKATMESLLDTLEFYSISKTETTKESILYAMKVVTNTKIFIRKEPNESSSKISTVYNNDIVDIYEINDRNYGRTKDGWIELSSLILAEPIERIVKEKANIRKYPEDSAQKLGRYSKGTTITITQIVSDWCRTNKGWVEISTLEN